MARDQDLDASNARSGRARCRSNVASCASSRWSPATRSAISFLRSSIIGGRAPVVSAQCPEWHQEATLAASSSTTDGCTPFGRRTLESLQSQHPRPFCPGLASGSSTLTAEMDQQHPNAALGNEPIRIIGRDELKAKLDRHDDSSSSWRSNRWAFDAKHIPGSLHFDSPDELYAAIRAGCSTGGRRAPARGLVRESAMRTSGRPRPPRPQAVPMRRRSRPNGEAGTSSPISYGS